MIRITVRYYDYAVAIWWLKRNGLSQVSAHLAAPIFAAGFHKHRRVRWLGLGALGNSPSVRDRRVVHKHAPELLDSPSRWDERTILTLGDQYTELDGLIAALRPKWFGEKNAELTRLQQASTSSPADAWNPLKAD